MNGGLGLCLMFVLAAAQVGESSSGKVAGTMMMMMMMVLVNMVMMTV